MTHKMYWNPRKESSERSRRLAPEAGAPDVGLSTAAGGSLGETSTSEAEAISPLSLVTFVVACAQKYFFIEIPKWTN
jgi:hypothetical protein